MEILTAFGRPEEVAARYHPQYTIIDPADTRGYVTAAAAGLTVLSVVVAPALRERAGASQLDELLFLAWLGFLVLAFALKRWAWRRWPDLGVWKPKPLVDRDRAARIGNIVIAVGSVVALAIYLAPTVVLALPPGGMVDPVVMAYTEDFRSPLRMPWLIGILAGFAVLHLYVGLNGRWTRWTRWTRWIDAALTLHIGLQLGCT